MVGVAFVGAAARARLAAGAVCFAAGSGAAGVDGGWELDVAAAVRWAGVEAGAAASFGEDCLLLLAAGGEVTDVFAAERAAATARSGWVADCEALLAGAGVFDCRAGEAAATCGAAVGSEDC